MCQADRRGERVIQRLIHRAAQSGRERRIRSEGATAIRDLESIGRRGSGYPGGAPASSASRPMLRACAIKQSVGAAFLDLARPTHVEGVRQRGGTAGVSAESPLVRDLGGGTRMHDEALVYVVDDDDAVRRALSRLLRSVGLEVLTFPSAQAFLDHRRLDRTACLVLDVRLPGPSGLDLQTALEGDRRTPPIVFITGHGDVPISVRAMKHGAVDFLQKPFHDQDLLDAVHAALRRSRQERAEGAELAVLGHRRDTLTPREREVLDLVVTGMPNKQIAAMLGTAEKTIKVHRARVDRKSVV